MKPNWIPNWGKCWFRVLCYFEEEDGLVVVDYKTDRVKTAAELVERYQVQLDSYADALAKLTHKKVKEKIIWAARLGEIVTV